MGGVNLSQSLTNHLFLEPMDFLGVQKTDYCNFYLNVFVEAS